MVGAGAPGSVELHRHVTKLSVFMSAPAEIASQNTNTEAGGGASIVFALYLLFCASFFLRFPERAKELGAIRFDFLLLAVIAIGLVFGGTLAQRIGRPNGANRALSVLLIYIALTLPFVQWPGSVVQTNAFIFIKAVVFFYLSILTLTTPRRLQIFMSVFLLCQIVRILEPLYMNLTTGYWGSRTHLGEGEFLERLAGSPYDTVNPNGLAFVVTSVIPLLYFLYIRQRGIWRYVSIALLPALLYTLVLTASRTGMIALFIVFLGIVWKSKHRITWLVLVGLIAVVGFGSLSEFQQDRYLSLTDEHTRGWATAKGRVEGVISDLEVALQRPIVGHGLGTSEEANFHATGEAQLSHNLYTETAQELGFVGLTIFVFYIIAVIRNFRLAREQTHSVAPQSYLGRLTDGMQVWMYMNLVFSLASYGLSSYEWYLFGGISVVLVRLSGSVMNDSARRPQSTEDAGSELG